jgi:hypothetical protein
MKRTRTMLWLLLLLQLAPLLVVILGASGVLDPLGRLVIQSIPLPGPGEKAGLLINSVRFITAYWFVGCLWLMPLGSLAAVVYVAFDAALTKLERLTWAVSFILGQYVTVILYCVLKFLAGRKQSVPSVA